MRPELFFIFKKKILCTLHNKNKNVVLLQQFGVYHWGFGYGQEPFIRAGCEINTCYTTPNRTEFNELEIDALIFHFWDPDKSLPKKR